MHKTDINANDKKILHALGKGISKREDILKVTGLSQMQIRRSLEKLISSDYRFVKRVRKGHYGLTEEGRKKEEEERVKSDKMLHIGEDFSGKISSYIKNKVPAGFQSIVRLILCEMHSRQSEEIFNHPAHSSGYSSVILVGDPKKMKTPIIEAVCKIVGESFENHKFIVGATKRETIGGWKNLPGKGLIFIPSPWVNRNLVIFDDFNDIIKNKQLREGVLILAHGDRSFRRGERIIVQHCVPFITFNTRTSTISENIKEIEKVLGAEYVKRGIVVNANSFAASLEDSAILTRKMLKSVPRLNLKAFPVGKTQLTDKEFLFMYNILKKATVPEKRKLFDERSIGRRVLSRYALSKSENMMDSIFQTCIDELDRLQTLDVTVEDWRPELIKDWKEERPGKPELKKIWQEEEERRRKTEQEQEKEQKKRREEMEKEKDEELNRKAIFNAKYNKELDKMKKLLLDSKTIPDFKNRRDALNEEYQNFKRGSFEKKEKKFEQLKRRIPYWEKELESYRIKQKEEQERIERENEERENIAEELRNLKNELHSLTGSDSKGRFWRDRTDQLRSKIGRVIKQHKKLPLNRLKDLLAESKLEKVKIFFSKEIDELKKKLIKFCGKQEEEVIVKIEYLDKWLSWIKNSNDLETIETAKEEDLPDIKRAVDELISFLKEKKKKQEVEQDIVERKKVIVREKYQTLRKGFETYTELTGGMTEEHNQQNKRYLESLLSDINKADNINILASIKLKIEKDIEDVNTWIKKKETEKERAKEEEETRKEKSKKEQELNRKIEAIEKEKKELSEKLTKPLTWRDYSDAERLEENQIKTYLSRKKSDEKTVSEMVMLAKKYLHKMSFEEKWSYYCKLPSDKKWEWDQFSDWYLAFGKTYLLANINLVDIKEILIGRIKEIDNETKRRRDKNLQEEWDELNREKQKLEGIIQEQRRAEITKTLQGLKKITEDKKQTEAAKLKAKTNNVAGTTKLDFSKIIKNPNLLDILEKYKNDQDSQSDITHNQKADPVLNNDRKLSNQIDPLNPACPVCGSPLQRENTLYLCCPKCGKSYLG